MCSGRQPVRPHVSNAAATPRIAAFPRATVSVAAFTAVVGGVTAAHAAGVLSIRAVASSPSAVAAGRVWLLVTSGLIVQAPIALSLLAFVGLAALTLVLCGPRRLWTAAALGHIASTLLTYGLIASARQVDADALGGVWRAADYGVSAISAAWLGAVAAAAWDRRGPRLRDRVSVIVSCVAVAIFAWMVRRHLTIVDSEHVFAFAIGVAVARAVQPHAQTSAGRGRLTPRRAS